MLVCQTTPYTCNCGTTGQSVGAFLARGVTGFGREGNDYVGKGLSGGRIIIRPNTEFRGAGSRQYYLRQYGVVWRDSLVRLSLTVWLENVSLCVIRGDRDCGRNRRPRL